jgi:hypothetical protein
MLARLCANARGAATSQLGLGEDDLKQEVDAMPYYFTAGLERRPDGPGAGAFSGPAGSARSAGL